MVTVVMGEMIPVVRRTPVGIVRSAPTVVHRRTLVVNRFNDIVHTVDVRRAYNLNIRRGITHLHYQRGNILIDVSCQHGLDEQHMVVALDGLQHAQVIDISVVIEVEVRYDVRVRVQDHLKLLYRVRLRESRSHGLKIQIQTDILGQRSHIYSSGTRSVRARVRDGCTYRSGIYRCRLSYYHCLGLSGYYDRLRSGSYGNDTSHTATCQQQWQG